MEMIFGMITIVAIIALWRQIVLLVAIVVPGLLILAGLAFLNYDWRLGSFVILTGVSGYCLAWEYRDRLIGVPTV